MSSDTRTTASQAAVDPDSLSETTLKDDVAKRMSMNAAKFDAGMDELIEKLKQQQLLIEYQKNELERKCSEVSSLRHALDQDQGVDDSVQLQETSGSSLNLMSNNCFPSKDSLADMNDERYNQFFDTALEIGPSPSELQRASTLPKVNNGPVFPNPFDQQYPVQAQAQMQALPSIGHLDGTSDRAFSILQPDFSIARSSYQRTGTWNGTDAPVSSDPNRIMDATAPRSQPDSFTRFGGLWNTTRGHSSSSYDNDQSTFPNRSFISGRGSTSFGNEVNSNHNNSWVNPSMKQNARFPTDYGHSHSGFEWHSQDYDGNSPFNYYGQLSSFHGNSPQSHGGVIGRPHMRGLHFGNETMFGDGPTAKLPTPIGHNISPTPLSPTAAEFKVGPVITTSGGLWNSNNTHNRTPPTTYVPPVEPLNYRSLLEKSVDCNWEYIVEKIVSSNDQQASIFLQQKLKISSAEQKHAIVDAIIDHAFPLMVNRFGNFLVQRCFEHGTPQQVDMIAIAIKGRTLQLSMDAFGCHVIQKAFDSVSEPYKATMVHELLRNIPDTVVHRYACHVWQKLFELRWVDSPPQIMKYVNEALKGRWPEVALGETGSLVVQNIFENCLEEDKRPCINEVLNSIDIIARGQYGNWCIQHICEHGATHDRAVAVDTIIRNAADYSMDQFASKVIEKCLKCGGPEFLERYLDRVCEGRQDRPRIPLIDIASDQYGNYLVQYVLQMAPPYWREIVASHIRKHMVSLRGSKFGSRVGMLCSNQNFVRNPGSPATAPAASGNDATTGSGGAANNNNNNGGNRFGHRWNNYRQ